MNITMKEKVKEFVNLEDEDLVDAVVSRIKSITNTLREINMENQRFFEEFDRRERMYREKRKLYEADKKNYSHSQIS
jgi:predicted nuclease with TOPRIM domain